MTSLVWGLLLGWLLIHTSALVVLRRARRGGDPDLERGFAAGMVVGAVGLIVTASLLAWLFDHVHITIQL